MQCATCKQRLLILRTTHHGFEVKRMGSEVMRITWTWFCFFKTSIMPPKFSRLNGDDRNSARPSERVSLFSWTKILLHINLIYSDQLDLCPCVVENITSFHMGNLLPVFLLNRIQLEWSCVKLHYVILCNLFDIHAYIIILRIENTDLLLYLYSIYYASIVFCHVLPVKGHFTHYFFSWSL